MERHGVTRREFLVGGATAFGTLATTGAFGQRKNRSAISRRVLHIIGYSHIDAAWLWPWRDASNTVLSTARSALDRMKETPGFHFTASSSIHYKWIEEADPRMFAEVIRRIREGRWEVVGGWPVETDCNLPAAESFARGGLYGKTYCRQALGVDVKIGFNPDSFGHAAGLPTILKQSGYDYYVFMRPKPGVDKNVELPLLFWWEGPDGSRVLTLRILNHYDNPASRIPEVAGSSFAPGFSDGAFFLGVGDHGGAVTKAQIKNLLELRNDASLPELRWSTVREFFQGVQASPAMANLPVIRGGLEHVMPGCYSACGEVKYQNRRAERAMVLAESLSWLNSVALKRSYPKAKFEEAWWNILFNQFHDLLAGTALYSDYQNARDGLGSACQTAMDVKVKALESFARQVDTSQAAAGLVFVFNTLPWPRKALLEYIPGPRTGEPPIEYWKTLDGTKILPQVRLPEGMTGGNKPLAAWVDLPAFGYRVLSEEFDAAPPAEAVYSSLVSVSDKSFGISSLKAADGSELLASPLGLVAISDTSDTWGNGIESFSKEIGRPTLISSKMVEDGPVLRVTRQRLKWQQSEIAADITTYSQMDIVKLHFVIDWRQHQQILKLEVPTALTGARVFAKVPAAVAETPTDGNEQPYHDWVAVQGTRGGKQYTVALLNNSTYSYDCLNGQLRTVLIRSAAYAEHPPVQPESLDAWQDQGRQERTFWLVGRPGTYTEQNLDRLANELQSPAEYVMDSRHGGTKGWEDSFLEITPSTVSVLAIKQAEGPGEAMIIRLQERTGKHTTAHLKSSLLRLNGDVVLNPWELKTVRIETSSSTPAKLRAVSILET